VNQENQPDSLNGHADPKAAKCFISTRDLGRLLGVEPSTLAAWRRRGSGPTWYQIEGHLIRYDKAEVLTWIGSQANSKSAELSGPKEVTNDLDA
jgi:predicted DNA-binding transcriptional regulator AlpA